MEGSENHNSESSNPDPERQVLYILSYGYAKFGSLDLYVLTGVTREFRKLVRHCGRNRNQDEGKRKGKNKIGKDK